MLLRSPEQRSFYSSKPGWESCACDMPSPATRRHQRWLRVEGWSQRFTLPSSSLGTTAGRPGSAPLRWPPNASPVLSCPARLPLCSQLPAQAGPLGLAAKGSPHCPARAKQAIALCPENRKLLVGCSEMSTCL